MTVKVDELIDQLQPNRTVLLFGAGSSRPSGAPSVTDLQEHFEKIFSISGKDYTLAEQTAIIEHRTRDRARLIAELRSTFRGLRPTGALLNLPLYDWKSIFTTNYDQLIEDSYTRRTRAKSVYTSNFDFGVRSDPSAVQIFKLHGTIEQDVSDGHRSRIVLTANDYDLVSEYREQLFDRLKSDLAGSHLIIIGHSLGDPDIKDVVDRALLLNSKSGGGGHITILSYDRDDGRAALFESRGLSVCFGSLDDFFAGLAARITITPPAASSEDPLDTRTALRPATLDVGHQRTQVATNVGAMFNGWPASYADIAAGFTFNRELAGQLVQQLTKNERHIAVILGPSGVGKTTAARQALSTLFRNGFLCWEHKSDQSVLIEEWRDVAAQLKADNVNGCLFIDDAHTELAEVNDLLDYLASDNNKSLRLVLVSSNSQWHPRIKTPSLHKGGVEYSLNRVHGNEIDRLLDLAENVTAVKSLVEENFAGFSRSERRMRLTERCEADMFVCLKNIFSSDKLDDIMLREYATLAQPLQDIYKIVAAMEAAGVRVHRQLIIRLLGIHPQKIGALLDGLADIIHEQTVDAREGVYAWKGRHLVIMTIIAQHKYYQQNKRYDLFEKVIDAISPTYDIEIRTIRELCNVETGLATISDRRQQNVLLRKMLSAAPRERVPRHRLIRNLISLADYDAAEIEIKLFEKDFRLDGPAARYKIDLALARAVKSPGLMHEDRLVLLDKAREQAAAAAFKFKENKSVLTAYCEVALELMRMTKKRTEFDNAIRQLKEAEERTSDPDISRRIARLDARANLISTEENIEFGLLAVEED